MNSYKYEKETSLTFEEAVSNLKAKLQENGFKVISELNATAIFKEKLGKDFTDYLIVSACNPKFSYEMLNEELSIGVFLPCSFVVYKKDSKTIVSASLPTALISLTGNEKALQIAKEVDLIFKNIIDSF